MIGTPRIHYRLTDSTNERAKEAVAAGAPHGTLVTADEQTGGRGRQGRVWTAPARSSLLMSVVLRDLDERHAFLPLAAAVAVCEAVPVKAAIKWPNDIWVDGRKLAGILVEGRPQAGWAVLGVGLNVTTDAFPTDLAETATSLRLAGVTATPDSVLGDLVGSLSEWLSAPPEAVLAAWRSRDALKGEHVRWSDGEGIANGIDDSGALLVHTANGPVTLDAGEVHLLR